jgi:WXXGXW repeat (2 copies)
MRFPTHWFSLINSTTVRAFMPSLFLAGALLLSAPSQGGAGILTDVPPPPPKVEHQPPHRDGYAWAPGYWEWNGRFFHWVSGTWIAERRGSWIPDHWDPVGNQWHYVRGHWES